MALVLALGVMAILTIVATTVVSYTSANARHAGYSGARQQAYAAAEAGVNSAVAVLGLSTNNAIDPCLLHPPTNPSGTTCTSNAPIQTPYDGGTSTWYGTLDQTNQIWTVTSTGSFRNPTGPGAAAVTRTLRATVPISANQNDTANTAVWNYIVATRTSNSTTCDVTLANSVQIDEPLYVAGNLCMNNTSQMLQPSSTTASTLLNTASPLALPVVDDANAYNTAKPGPKNPCSATSGTAPTWDNDTTLDLTNYPNGSVPSAFNLTPGSNYTCQATDGSGNIVGQLDWNNTTKTLTIKGKMYIDGSVYSNNGAVNIYSGSATLYLSGTFSITNSTKICGSTAGAACDFSSWTPNSNILVVVAHGDNGAGYSIAMANTTKWQGGFFATKGIDLGQSSTDEGPMFASNINLSNSVTVKPLPAITNLPLGAPISPNVHAAPDRPSYSG